VPLAKNADPVLSFMPRLRFRAWAKISFAGECIERFLYDF
jgi:hypothetical protein